MVDDGFVHIQWRTEFYEKLRPFGQHVFSKAFVEPHVLCHL